MRCRHAGLTAAIAAAALALPLPAAARKLQMSGTWAIRFGAHFFLPLQFAQYQSTHTSMGDLSMGLGFPNTGPIRGSGVATATGSAPETLRVPRHRFRTSPFAASPLCCTNVQITTMLVVDAPFETATLRAAGGPGSFTWCPDETLGCPVTGPPNGGTRNGRVIYRAGANQFGGTMQIGLAGGGISSFLSAAIPFRVGNVYIFGTGPRLRAPAVGRGIPASPWTRRSYLRPGVVTQPTMAPASDELVLYPGPKLTTMLGLTTSGTGPTFRFPGVGMSAAGMSVGISYLEFGFAHTTGTVIVQQTTGIYGEGFFTVMGSDMRTPLGAGNISTVAGGISFRNTVAGQTPHATFHKLWFSLLPPVPSLAPPGLAAAAALVLLAVGYTMRRGVVR